MKVEKTIILLIAAVFFTTSLMRLSSIPDPSTKEGAIRISKEAKLVKYGLATSHSFSVEAHFLNASTVERLKKGHLRAIFEKVPEGHSVWEMKWWFRPERALWSYSVIVEVDNETGALIHEEMGIGLELVRKQQ
jgi:hypothetical protein